MERNCDLLFQHWHKEFDKFWPEHSNVSKVFTLMGSFWVKYTLFEVKRYRGVMFHETKEDTKFGEESACRFKIGIIGIWQILTWALKSLKNFHFNGLLLSKLYILWAEKVQRSYLSWNWRGIQNLERNWLVISKLT